MLRYLEMEFQRRDLLKTLQLEGDVVPLNPLPGRCPGPDPQKILGFGYPLLEALVSVDLFFFHYVVSLGKNEVEYFSPC